MHALSRMSVAILFAFGCAPAWSVAALGSSLAGAARAPAMAAPISPAFNAAARAPATSIARSTGTRAANPAAARDGFSAGFNTRAVGATPLNARPDFNRVAPRPVVRSPTREAARLVRLKNRFDSAGKNLRADPQRSFAEAAGGAKPYPPHRGFERGSAGAGTLPAGTVVGRYGSPGGSYVTRDLNATPASLALPYGQRAQPMHYYRLTAPVKDAVTGRAAPAYGLSGGGSQTVMPTPLHQAPAVRTIVPTFGKAATGTAYVPTVPARPVAALPSVTAPPASTGPGGR